MQKSLKDESLHVGFLCFLGLGGKNRQPQFGGRKSDPDLQGLLATLALAFGLAKTVELKAKSGELVMFRHEITQLSSKDSLPILPPA